jgi:PAS domain S-box-containing protein
MLAVAISMAALGSYAWRRRSTPGALPFAVASLFAMLWALGAVPELAAVHDPVKISWVKFQGVWQLPYMTALLCFVLEYANLGRWLTRRLLALLSIPPLLFFLLALSNDAHHWIWRGFLFAGDVRPLRGSLNWALTGYGFVMNLTRFVILTRLAVRSPLHRWPVMLMLGGQITTMATYLLDAANTNLFPPLDTLIFASLFSYTLIAIALFRFRMFDPVLAAHTRVIEQMQEGMLVLDTGGKIADLNPAAEKILSVPAKHMRGRDATDFLPGFDELIGRLDGGGAAQSEISLGEGRTARHYTLHLSPLKGRRDGLLGCLLLLHDVTGQKQVQAQLLEQQRVMAMLSERERLARELHDNIGQVLAFAGIEVETARKLLSDGQVEPLARLLVRLAVVIQEAHADVREDILNLRSAPTVQKPFFTALRQYLDGVSQNYGIQIELCAGAESNGAAFEPEAQMQLFRIIQEALSNARKHGQARRVQVILDAPDGLARLAIQDDGCGFDPAQAAATGGNHFGLQFMRERAEQLGGCLVIKSAPGAGTRIEVEVPVGVKSDQ